MPRAKSPARRVHTLPVRVVAAPAKPKVAFDPQQAPAAARKVETASVTLDTKTRLRIAWVAIGIIMAVIIVAWITTVGGSLTTPGQPNSLWLRIRANLRHVFSRQSDEPAFTIQDKNLQQLEQNIFPDLPK